MRHFSSQSSKALYEAKSAMHTPLLVLGITPSTVKLAKHLSQTLKQFEPYEVEFFSDYTSYLDKSDLTRDPLFDHRDDEYLACSQLATKHTLLKYATAESSEPGLKEFWSHFFASKAQRQVIKIEPERNLVHAISVTERVSHTYSYETLVVGADYSQQSDLNSKNIAWPFRIMPR